MARANDQPDALLTTWDAEEPDQRATQDLRGYVQGALRDLASAGQVDEILCKETLCRVRLRFDDVGDALQFDEESGFPERRKRVNISAVGAGMNVEVFLARE